MQVDLSDRAVIVTGGSKGIGAATARMLAGAGAKVLLVARGRAALEATAAECGAEGLALDVTADGAAERIVSVCQERFGRLDGLVNNAGFADIVAASEQTEEEWAQMFSVHVTAPRRLMRVAAPLMAAAGGGRIVNVCSVNSQQPAQENVAYSVAKAAELSLSRAFADEFAPRGVLVNAVMPGDVDSEMWMGPGGVAEKVAAAEGITPAEVVAMAGEEYPIGRIGKVDEVASVIVFLLSDLAANVAGAAWSVDGGYVRTTL
jgi:3-oxoacyl-[acyl-carrier protein] reductase